MTKGYTDEMTAACLGLTVEQYRAKYCGAAGKAQNALACAAVRAALTGDTENAQRFIAERNAMVQS